MGCDIHFLIEKKENDKWTLLKEDILQDYRENRYFLADRDYRHFSFLAGIRQRDNIKPISPPRGLPIDSEFLNKRFEEPNNSKYIHKSSIRGSYYTEKEVLENCSFDEYHTFSYLTILELSSFDYKQSATSFETYGEYLGESYFRDLSVLKKIGEPDKTRIIFWFDS